MPKHKPILPKSDYDVGYGKPPKGTRFQKGHSGNPGGRPKGVMNKSHAGVDRLKSIVLDEAYREIEITEKGDPVRIPMAQAVVRSLGVQAAKGKIGAQRLFIETVATVEQIERREKEELFTLASDYKKRKLKEIEQAKAAGIEIPLVLPHPDDIELNLSTAEVIYHGPVGEDDLAIWNQWWAEKSQHETEIEQWREALAEADEPKQSESLEASLDWSIFLGHA